MTTGKTILVTTNFRGYFGWGQCFGFNVYNVQIQSVQKGSLYEATISLSDKTKVFDMTRVCDIMGTNAGSEVFPGVAVPIVWAVTVDDTKLTMNQPCAANQCKDPGNGYKIGGYYTSWSVLGRQFNTYNIPYDSLNQLYYAFILFNPDTGTIRPYDVAADSWGMSAVTRAMLQYPYLEGFLSFGGWMNNDQTTAPMF